MGCTFRSPIPNSIDDKDVMGIYIGPLEHYLGFGRKDVYEQWEGEWDCVFYELRKFIGLLLNCNPNVLSLLWLKPNGIIYETPIGARLREHRDLFVTKKAYHSFSGYAHAQFKKMISFNQEAQALMQQLEEQLASFGIDPESCDAGHSLRTLNGQPFVGATTEMMEVVKRYRGERRRYYSGGYMGQKRRELVRRVGYDAKNAAHLIRLLRMGIEFLTEGTLHVERADAPELLDIKRGAWPLEKVKAESERLVSTLAGSLRPLATPTRTRPRSRGASVRRNDLGLSQSFAKLIGVSYNSSQDKSTMTLVIEEHEIAALPITVYPDVLGGVPVFSGTRVPVDALLSNLEAGVSLNEFLENFPTVSRQQALQVIEFSRATLHRLRKQK